MTSIKRRRVLLLTALAFALIEGRTDALAAAGVHRVEVHVALAPTQ